MRLACTPLTKIHINPEAHLLKSLALKVRKSFSWLLLRYFIKHVSMNINICYNISDEWQGNRVSVLMKQKDTRSSLILFSLRLHAKLAE